MVSVPNGTDYAGSMPIIGIDFHLLADHMTKFSFSLLLMFSLFDDFTHKSFTNELAFCSGY